jgi:hypothetical protein
MDEKYGIVLTFLFKKEKYGNNRKREKLGKNTKKKKVPEYHYNKSATHAFGDKLCQRHRGAAFASVSHAASAVAPAANVRKTLESIDVSFLINYESSFALLHRPTCV